MKIQIKNRYNGAVIFETDAESIVAAVSAAITVKADLRYADLRYADLSSADLRYAELRYADLRSANLSSANLRYAELRSANLSDANLSSANLRYANLSDANLSSANLSSANLSSANLRYAKMEDIEKILSTRSIVADGDLIVWKKLSNGTVAKLKIPARAKRIGGMVGRKCRAEYAVVIFGNGVSSHDSNFIYKKGKRVKPDKFDPNPLVECSNGIHFFITRKEAEDYDV